MTWTIIASVGRLITRATVLLFLLASTSVLLGDDDTEQRDEHSVIDCAGNDVRIRFANGEDPAVICSAASQAIETLRGFGIPQQSTVTINIVPLVTVARHLGFGCYDARADEVSVVSGRAFNQSSTGENFFRVPNNAQVYHSLIAHEVTHAIVAQNAPELLSMAAQEYIAAAVQFIVMDPDTRDAVLSHFPGNGFTSVSEINGSLYLFAPAWYLVSAYRHYARQREGADIVGRIVAGDIRLSDGLDE